MFCDIKKRRLFHNWGKWEESQRGPIRYWGKIVGYMIVQKRECKHCGYVQRKKQEIVV